MGFEIPLPDFTDCRFASREPDADWMAIVHSGGPARGFDRMMPAFGKALTGDEIQRILDYTRTFCTEKAWPRGELTLPRLLVTEKAYAEDELVFTTAVALEGRGEVENRLLYERRFGARNQFEITLPVAAQEQQIGGWSGSRPTSFTMRLVAAVNSFPGRAKLAVLREPSEKLSSVKAIDERSP